MAYSSFPNPTRKTTHAMADFRKKAVRTYTEQTDRTSHGTGLL